jgi:hypothetical protein
MFYNQAVSIETPLTDVESPTGTPHGRLILSNSPAGHKINCQKICPGPCVENRVRLIVPY